MANILTPSMISAEFWALLHRMGLPDHCDRATITLSTGEVVRVTADFALTDENGELQLVEDAIAKASEDYVFVRQADLEALEASLAAHRETGKQPGH